MVFGIWLNRIISVLSVDTLKGKRMVFDDDLEFGKQAETLVRDVLKVSGWQDTKLNEAADYATKKAYDLINWRFKCEVKYDRKYETTGNIFIELSCSGIDSGVWATEAEYWVFVTHEGGWVIPVRQLRFLLKHDRKNLGTHREYSGDGGRVRGITYPKEWMKKHFDKFINEDKTFDRERVHELFT